MADSNHDLSFEDLRERFPLVCDMTYKLSKAALCGAITGLILFRRRQMRLSYSVPFAVGATIGMNATQLQTDLNMQVSFTQQSELEKDIDDIQMKLDILSKVQ